MPVIKNFGFLWEKRYIVRGGGGKGNAGHLKGKAKGKVADFREQIGVYVLYDRNQSVVYVGQAGNGHARLFKRLCDHMEHETKSNRWEYFSWVGFRDVNINGQLSNNQDPGAAVSGFKYSDALNEIEGILIEIIEPKLNKQGGRLAGAVRYRQVVDHTNREVSNRELSEQLKGLELLLKRDAEGST